MRHLLSFILMKFKDQRGEVAEDLEDEVLTEEDVVEEEGDAVVNIDPEDLEEEEDEPEEDPEKETKKDLEAEAAEKDHKAELVKRDKEISKLNRNFYGMRKKFEALEKKGADEGVRFTRDQLKQMIEEHQDDPDVMLQIMEHVSKQTSDDAAKTHVDAAEISQRRKDLDGYLTASWPGAYDEGSKDHKDIQKAKDYLHLNDHPLGDYLAGAATMFLQVPDMLDNARKEAREGALKVEDNRKKTIKQTNLESGKKKSVSTKASNDQLSVAKQMGLSPSATKVYVKLLNNAKNAIVEA